jgi:hypothetical protein
MLALHELHLRVDPLYETLRIISFEVNLQEQRYTDVSSFYDSTLQVDKAFQWEP